MFRFNLLFAAFAAALLSACQTLPQVPYDRASAGSIKTINVVTPAMNEESRVVLASTVGQSFGLVGALIDAGMQASREDDFQAMAKAQNFAGKAAFAKHLDSALTTSGYAVAHDDVKRAANGDFLKAYAQPSTIPAEAHLDVVLHYGYYASGLSTPYRPFVTANVKLVRNSDSALLMQKSIFYNPLNAAPEQTVTVPPNPAYEFSDFDALKANPEKAIKGLDEALAQVANAMGTLVK
ncbi:MAG: hypothetical protein ACKVRO_19690 [Micropepsaceae bacterium]